MIKKDRQQKCIIIFTGGERVQQYCAWVTNKYGFLIILYFILSCYSKSFKYFTAIRKSHVLMPSGTVNRKKIARILISRIALKDIFAVLKIRDKGMIYLHQ